MTYRDLALSPELAEVIRRDSFQAENQERLSPGQLAIIHRKKWFHLFVPAAFGGLELSLPEAVRLEEGIAQADGSVAWVVTLCAGAAMFIGYFSEALAKGIFADEVVCLAGSGQATGIAKIIDGGFIINGCWPYASGAPDATHFTANCLIEPGGQTQSFIFTKEEVTLQSNWEYIGLKATAGYSFCVKDLLVPANRSFVISAATATLPHPVYRYPFLQLAETTIAANISGMSLSFFDLAKDSLSQKIPANTRAEAVRNKGLQLVTTGLHEIKILRQKFYAALDASWSSHVACNTITSLQLEAVSQTSLTLATRSRNLVNELYPYCGMNAARPDTIINQVWRNINTASQHSLLLSVMF